MRFGPSQPSVSSRSHPNSVEGTDARSHATPPPSGERRPRLALLAPSAVLAAMLGVAGGCEVRSFIDPSELGEYPRRPLVVDILDDLGLNLEADAQVFAQAEEVRPQDLEVVDADYTISAGDFLQVTITGLNAPGQESQIVRRVSESGRFSLPLIPQPLDAVDLTEAEFEQAIITAYDDEGIIRRESAQVAVAVVERRGRQFSLFGEIGRPGAYQILQNDFRLLDALVLGGGVPAGTGIDYIYIIRDPGQDPEGRNGSPRDPQRPPGDGDAPLVPQPRPGEPVDPLVPGGTGAVRRPQPFLSIAQVTAEGRTREGDGLTLFAQPTDGGATPTVPANAPADVSPTRRGGDVEGRIITIEGVTAPADPAATEPARPRTPVVLENPSDDGVGPTGPVRAADIETLEDLETAPAIDPDASDPFEFAPQEPTDRRVIRVPLEPLRSGQLRYNVVIRPNDFVVVPTPQIGLYYMGGHVARVGAYSLTGQRITLKQAIISAGMLDPVAIPQRTRIVRRIGPNEEVIARVNLDRVFSGLDPDVYLKPNDQVMVGTNFVAPFLAAIRNGFRVSYGFGFLYDRNFNTRNDRQF